MSPLRPGSPRGPIGPSGPGLPGTPGSPGSPFTPYRKINDFCSNFDAFHSFTVKSFLGNRIILMALNTLF